MLPRPLPPPDPGKNRRQFFDTVSEQEATEADQITREAPSFFVIIFFLQFIIGIGCSTPLDSVKGDRYGDQKQTIYSNLLRV